MKRRLLMLLTTLFVCFHAHQASAVLLLSEDFTGTGNTTGLQYTDPGSSTTVGGTESNGAKREGSGSTTFYGLGSSVNSGTVYFSVLYNQPSNFNWGGFSFYDGGTEKLFFGDAGWPYSGPFSIDRNGGSPPGADQSTVTIDDGRTYFMVGAYDFDTGTAMLWADPAFGGTIPLADLSVSYTSGWTLTQVRTGGDAVTDFDRIRVGTTWADVVPLNNVPEPPILALLALGLAGFGFARRVKVA